MRAVVLTLAVGPGVVWASSASAAIKLAPAGTVLVTNLATNSLSVINPLTGAVSHVSGAGLNGPLGIVVTPNARTAFVTNSLSNTISPVDLTTTPFRVGPAITVGAAPSAIALTPSGDEAYVSNFNDNTVTPVLVGGSRPRALAPIHVGAGPWSIAVTPDGRRVIVSNLEATTVSIIDTATETVSTVAVGGRPEAIAVAPTGETAYVLANAQVIPIDLATSPATVRSPISVPNIPVGIALSPRGTTAFTVNADNTVTHINLTTTPATVSRASAVGSLSQPDGVAVSPDGHTAYIANASDTVTPIDLSGPVALARPAIAVGSPSFGVAVIPDQAPTVVFSETLAAAGRLSTFNAAGSSAPNSHIALYQWNFGDGTRLTTRSPLVRHRYAAVGSYQVALTAVTIDGTSNVRTFTGQGVSNNGSAASRSVHVAHVLSPLAIVPGDGAPGTAVTVRDATLGSSCRPLDIFFDGRLVSQTVPLRQVVSDPAVVVPGDARVGAHTISIRCASSKKVLSSVAFSVVALRNHLSEFSVAMPTPTSLKKHLATAGLFSLLLLILGRVIAAGFPSVWMDGTYASNFERVTRRIRNRWPWLFIDHTRPRPPARRYVVGTLRLVLFVAAASLIDSFLSPGFGLNRTSLWLFVGQGLGILAITLISQGPVALVGLREKKFVHLRVLLGGLVIAVICVVTSRSLGLAPGYCYGLIAVYVLNPAPNLRTEGRYHFISSMVVLSLATAAFFLTVPVFRVATSAHPALWAVLLDPVLNMVFLAGFSGVAFGMFPLPFLPGHAVARWHRPAWAFLSVVSLMGYIAVVLSPGSGTADELHSVGIVPLLVAFVLFGAASLGFWGYHVWRAKTSGELEHVSEEDQEDFEAFAN